VSDADDRLPVTYGGLVGTCVVFLLGWAVTGFSLWGANIRAHALAQVQVGEQIAVAGRILGPSRRSQPYDWPFAQAGDVEHWHTWPGPLWSSETVVVVEREGRVFRCFWR
jgi:hypothetical protein